MNNLEHDLIAAGYTPVPLGLKGIVAWTGWHAPVQKDTYEIYYDLICEAMYAQMDWSPWDRPHATRSFAIHQQLVNEYRAVVNCWRSASDVPPAPGVR